MRATATWLIRAGAVILAVGLLYPWVLDSMPVEPESAFQRLLGQNVREPHFRIVATEAATDYTQGVLVAIGLILLGAGCIMKRRGRQAGGI